jgi:hypothetical protein
MTARKAETTTTAKGTAGLSTAPFAKYANGFAQDDKVLGEFRMLSEN